MLAPIQHPSPEAVKICSQFGVTDAAETALFSRALEHIKSRVFEVKYEEMKARNLVPFSTEAGPTADYVTYRVFDAYVQAVIISRMTTAIPMVNASGREYKVSFKNVGDGYQYSWEDAQKASATGSDYLARLAIAARRGIELAFDEIVALGNPETGMTGLANHPNVPVVSVPNGSWTSSTSTDLMFADLFYLDHVVGNNTHQIFQGKTLLLPNAAFQLAAGALVGVNKDSSVLTRFLQTSQNIKEIDQWNRLDTAGVGGTKRGVLYTRDPEILEAEVAVNYAELPAQFEGFQTKVHAYGRLAGVSVHHPNAMAYIDNLVA